MAPIDWNRIESTFQEALEVPPADREQWLLDHCGEEAELRMEVESLLAAEGESAGFLRNPNLAQVASQLLGDEGEASGTPQHVGAYEILREIGRGGMGVVYLAAREDEVFRKHVAIKLVKRGVDTDDILRRFRNERQILASLNHPNIAKLFDGGTTDDGRPYFVMEYIEGLPLTRYCEEHQLATDERLQLFRTICSAVSHAHQNLIVHRDLKPSNILITPDGEPKLLDFGVAKVLNPESTGAELTQTQTRFRVLTPEYASPEQVRGEHISTASDIYSLGVILYELLTGGRPYKLRGNSPEEVARAICDSDPSKPSEAVSSLWSGARGKHSSTGQSSDLRSDAPNPKLLRGDLDNITLKALHKDPPRRYRSVAEFADDIERHLGHLPISARPNTLSYRTSRFYKRNKIAVSATALIMLALIAGLAIALWQYSNARRENTKAEVVNDFLKQMLATASSGIGGRKGYQTTITDILEDAERRLESDELRNQPEVRAELRQVVGLGYVEQGNYIAGEKNLRLALAEQIQLYGVDSPKSLITEFGLASLSFSKADYDSAEHIYAQRFPLLRDEFRKGKIDPDTLTRNLSNYAILCRARGDSIQAESLLREGLAISVQHSSEAQTDILSQFLALIFIDRGKFDEAESLQRATLSKLRQLPNNNTPEFCSALTLYGIILMERGDLSGADSSLREGESIYRKLYSPNHIAIYDNLRLQAQVSYLAGRYAEAEATIDQVLENYRQNSNPKYISFATALTVQGLILNKLGRGDEAERILREAVKLRQENLPANHFMTALTKGALGECLTARKRYDEAESLLIASYDSLKASQSEQNPRTLEALQRLTFLYDAWNKPSQAAQYRALLPRP